MKTLSVIRPRPDAYEWKWRIENPHKDTTGIKIGYHCLFLGEIPDVPHHCAVIRKDGIIVWALHTEEFELVPEAEL